MPRWIALLAALVILTGCTRTYSSRSPAPPSQAGDMTPQPARRPAPWTVQAEQTVVTRDETWIGSGVFREHYATLRVWFVPDTGWRLETDSDALPGGSKLIAGMDGRTLWE